MPRPISSLKQLLKKAKDHRAEQTTTPPSIYTKQEEHNDVFESSLRDAFLAVAVAGVATYFANPTAIQQSVEVAASLFQTMGAQDIVPPVHPELPTQVVQIFELGAAVACGEIAVRSYKHHKKQAIEATVKQGTCLRA